MVLGVKTRCRITLCHVPWKERMFTEHVQRLTLCVPDNIDININVDINIKAPGALFWDP